MSLQYTLNQIKSSNLREHDPVLFNNVKEIMDSRDPEYIKELYEFIRNDSEKRANSITDNSFNKNLTDNIHHFWNNYYSFFVGDSNTLFFKH
jgi:hypothetical protein